MVASVAPGAAAAHKRAASLVFWEVERRLKQFPDADMLNPLGQMLTLSTGSAVARSTRQAMRSRGAAMISHRSPEMFQVKKELKKMERKE
jgi:hypothetical protein